MNYKIAFGEDYQAYLLNFEQSLQKSAPPEIELQEIKLIPDCQKNSQIAGPCQNPALAPLNWWIEA